MAQSEPPAALEVRNLSKTFAGGPALDGVSFAVRPGTVHALLGGNGSGKSTLVKSIAGVQSADGGGSVVVRGVKTATEHLSPGWARRSGLRFVHQNPGIFADMTVADNIRIGVGFPGRLGAIGRRSLDREVRQALERVRLDVSPNAVMGELRVADQTMVAIARALQQQDDEDDIAVLVLDEPTAALPKEEVDVLLKAVRHAASSGIAVIYVSHRLEEVLSIADAITVLRDSREIVTRSADGLTEKDLISYIVGRPLASVFPPSDRDAENFPVVAELRGVSAGPLRDIDLTVRAGEILGIAGLLGAGRTEVLRVLFGDLPAESGEVLLAGRAVQLRTPSSAIREGIAYVPEDRDTEASFSDQTVRENIAAASVSASAVLGRIRHSAERAAVRRSMKDFRVKASNEEALMSSLSGGNRQKVILARWMRREPRLLLLDEPTQGVDIGARADAYQLIRRAVSDGAAAILVSSDFEELADMSDRVVVLVDGRLTAEVRRDEIDRHRLTELVFTATKEIA